MTRFGVVLPQQSATREDVMECAKAAHLGGLDSIWTSDFLTGRSTPDRPVLDGWTCLAAAASLDLPLTFGTLVIRAGMRPPALIASMFRSLSKIAPGRVIAGLGVGDSSSRAEQESYGMTFRSAAERFELLKKTIDAIRQGAPSVPLWIGGASQKLVELLPLVDGWNFWGAPDKFVEISPKIHGSLIKSWAGSYPGPKGIEEVIQAGADEVIIPVGAGNFQDRIEALSEIRRSLGNNRT